MVSTLCKTIWHQQVEHIANVEAIALVTAHLTLLQLVVHNLTLHFSLFIFHLKRQFHRAWLGILQIQIYQQVVGRVETYQTVYHHTRIVGGDTLCVPDTLTVYHQLNLGVLHADEPICRVNASNCLFLFCSMHCHCSTQQ